MNYNQYGYPQYNGTSAPSPYQQPYGQQAVIQPNKIFVNDLEDAKSRLLSPNSSAIFWDISKPIIYEKIVAADGSFIINVYNKVIEPGSVTRDEFIELEKRFEELSALVKGKEVVNA